eukprot:GFUD01020239.1.p1 GENE.GFUD01020239.1~~GFUD01020239.1.p1  ORF type:complete len:365 (+),score=88.28 GFUD01020239.1:246-1340(+)
MGGSKCYVCGVCTAFWCRCGPCDKSGKENRIYICSRECKMSNKALKHLEPNTVGPSKSSNNQNDRIVLHSTLAQPPSEDEDEDDLEVETTEVSDEELAVADVPLVTANADVSAPQNITPASVDEGTSSRKRKKATTPSSLRNAAKKKRSDADNEERRAGLKKARNLTDLFKKVTEKVHQLERLTPTWEWVFNIKKNVFNTRSSKHKYKSAEKASDLARKVIVNRVSRTFNSCLADIKIIENLDPNYIVTLQATKPEDGTSRKKNIHDYTTRLDDEEASSQGSRTGCSSSDEIATSQEIDEEEVILSCRICRDDVSMQDVVSNIACLKPAGKAHFGAHFKCLGLFPTSKSDRIELRSMYRCPAHN